MRIAILGNSPGWSLDELQKAAGSRHKLTFVEWSQLTARLGSRERVSSGEMAGSANPVADVVLVRGMPLGSLEQVVFRMDVLARWQATGVRVVNSPHSLEIAIDKYRSLALIRDAGLSVPETIVCQTVDASMHAFGELGEDAVIKPVFGGEGRGILRVSEPEIARRAFQTIIGLQGIVYLQQFINHGNTDQRLLVIGQDVLGMSRRNPDDWRTNASLGAECSPFIPNAEQTDMALQAARSVDAEIAGVDIVVNELGQSFVLEVNGIPGWKAIAAANGVDVAERVIRYLESVI